MTTKYEFKLDEEQTKRFEKWAKNQAKKAFLKLIGLKEE
jgi:hypothetical protein